MRMSTCRTWNSSVWYLCDIFPHVVLKHIYQNRHMSILHIENYSISHEHSVCAFADYLYENLYKDTFHTGRTEPCHELLLRVYLGHFYNLRQIGTYHIWMALPSHGPFLHAFCGQLCVLSHEDKDHIYIFRPQSYYLSVAVKFHRQGLSAKRKRNTHQLLREDRERRNEPEHGLLSTVQALLDFVTTMGQGPNRHKIQ